MITQIQQYLWLANTILSAGRITRDQINRRWAYSSINEDHTSAIPERTFHHWRQGAESILDINIDCDRHDGNKYYISHSERLKKDQSKRWLLDSFAVSSVFKDADLHPFVLLEQMPSDSQYLTPIIDAIRHRKVLSITYQRFNATQQRTFTMCPYCVKTFKRRWYMVGLSSDHPNEIRVYALDRILSIEILEQTYQIPLNFDGQDYFKHSYGIFRGNAQPEHIVIEVNEMEAKYLRSLPLHSSQKEIPNSPSAQRSASPQGGLLSRFEFYLAPTFDFEQELRTFGANLKVIEPQSLADKFKQLGEDYLKLYNS